MAACAEEDGEGEGVGRRTLAKRRSGSLPDILSGSRRSSRAAVGGAASCCRSSASNAAARDGVALGWRCGGKRGAEASGRVRARAEVQEQCAERDRVGAYGMGPLRRFEEVVVLRAQELLEVLVLRASVRATETVKTTVVRSRDGLAGVPCLFKVVIVVVVVLVGQMEVRAVVLVILTVQHRQVSG